MEKRKSVSPLINAKLISCLLSDVAPIIEALGEPRQEDRWFSFPARNPPFSRFTVGYDLKKYFLGRIYHLTVEGRFSSLAPVSFSGALDLHFSGLIRKGKPFFIPKGSPGERSSGNGFIQVLNTDQCLLEECLRLDVEFLKVLFDPLDGWGRIQIRPYGGSLLHIFMPPLNYHVKLIKEQAVLLLSVMYRIGNLFYEFQSSTGRTLCQTD